VTPLPLPLKLALLILGAALLGAILALVLPRATVRVTEFRVNANGLDELVLSCTDCPDGTRLRHGASEALFFGGQAKLLTARRLSVGENELEVALIEPGERASGMHLHVPVAFRVEVDLSGISAPTPFAEVIVQAEPGARVSVSGQEVPLLDGRARYRLELSEEATGSSSRLRKVSREVPVSVSSDNEVRRTQARMTAPITPLALEAQGALVDSGALYGRSAAGARIEVVQAGRSLGMARADAEGRFEVPLPTPGPEDLLVSASLDGHVTRQVRLPANTKL